ncbi:hypothetical protein A2118_02250 [Candidatus Kaiserbacteria bacterium GWA2_50_9]|uniref:Uncharacterized protein n=1 Tax=Candidatus Kaiserbacteria bacterium GWA2_50_9 TaxID=1798474 RepID=A0A1F6BTN9_9BACT|nr:MAG: hypothetical protein A2118_02250 [Candidatus Kaiserbacteria bacterium GWA2_50_9]
MSTIFHRPTRGYIVIFALIVSAAIMTVTTAFFNYYGSAVHAERFSFASAQAQALAEAGIDKAVYELNQSAGYSGESEIALGNGTYNVSIASIDGNTKRVTATSYVPNSTNPTAKKVVQATIGIDASVVSFNYGVQIGQGGVTMSNGSRIEGNIFVNGSISGSGTITGDATVAMGTDPIANQQWTVQNSSFNLGDIAANANVAQSFNPTVSSSLAKVSLNIKKTGNPGDITIKIVTDNSGKPSKTVLASGTIPASLVTTAYGLADATLDSTPALTADQTYWIIAIASVNASNYFIWGRDSSGGYSRGAAKYSSNWNASSPTWTSITGDLNFKMYISGVPTTLSGVTVGGNAWAYSLSSCSVGGNASYQTISSCSVSGTQYPGAAVAAPIPLPISDAQITDWEETATAGGTIAGPYSVSGTQTLGPKKINGDLTVTNGNILILSGPVWVNGNITLSNNAILRVSSGTGSNGAILIADATNATTTKGKVNISNNVVVEGNGSANSFPMIISTNTGSEAIEFSNNADGVILYAPYGGIEVSNGASANQITAKQLELENNATITYENGLQNASFSNGPGGSWEVVPGTYAITQ